MTTNTSLIVLSPEENLQSYMKQIRKFPVLGSDEEFALARQWKEKGDRNAAHKLVTSHLRLVVKIAGGYRGYGLPVLDLISEGNIGMMHAVKKFDPDRGFRLATYAMWWIRASIQEYILRSWSLVKLGTTAAQKKLFFNLRRIKSKLQSLGDGDLPTQTVTKISRELSVPERDVVSMNQRLSGVDSSLNAPVHMDGAVQLQDLLSDERDNQEMVYADNQEQDKRRALLLQGFSALDERERTILSQRWLRDKPKTLEELSGDFSVSRERIRQIEERALTKVRKFIQKIAPDAGIEFAVTT